MVLVTPDLGEVETEQGGEGEREKEGEMGCSSSRQSWWWSGRGQSSNAQAYLSADHVFFGDEIFLTRRAHSGHATCAQYARSVHHRAGLPMCVTDRARAR